MFVIHVGQTLPQRTIFVPSTILFRSVNKNEFLSWHDDKHVNPITINTMQRTDEDLAIKNAIERASTWRKYMTYIDAQEQKTYEQPHHQQQPPSPSYICHRCKLPGHRIRQCPTNGDKAFDKPRERQGCAGIPRDFLKSVTSEEAGKNMDALIANDGLFYLVAPRSELFEREMKRDRECKTTSNSVPSHLTCLMCKDLIKDAMILPCCSTSFCQSCIFPPYDSPQDPLYCPLCKR